MDAENVANSGGEGGIQLARFASSLQTCRYAAAFVEQGSHPQPHSARKQKGPARGPFDFLAERVGFEPTVRENRTPDFESGPFDHSGTSPLICSVFSYRRPADASTPDLTRRVAPRPAGALRASKRQSRLSIRPIRPLWHLSIGLFRPVGAEILVSNPVNVKGPFSLFECDNRGFGDMGSRTCDYCSSSLWRF